MAGAAGGDPYWRLWRAGVCKKWRPRSAVQVRGWSRAIGLDWINAKEEEDWIKRREAGEKKAGRGKL